MTQARHTVLMIILTAVMIGCNHQDAENETKTDYETITVTKSNVTMEQIYPASIEGRQSVKIIPRVEGYLSEVRIKEGQKVVKGQVLFVLDQATFLAEVKAAEANVAMAQANLANVQLKYDSRKSLLEKDIISDYEVKLANTDLQMAQAQAKQAAAQLENARANLSYTTLRSPSNGVVGSLPYRIGDLVGPSKTEGLTTIADISEIYAFFSLNEQDVMGRIKKTGSLNNLVASFPPVKLQLSDSEIYTLNGRVQSISGIVDPSTGAVSARAVFSNAGGMLLSGSTASIIIPYIEQQVVVIPQSATFEIQDKVYVYKVVRGRAQSTIVNVTATTDGQRYIVKDGIVEGDIIVGRGARYVKDGQVITSKH